VPHLLRGESAHYEHARALIFNEEDSERYCITTQQATNTTTPSTTQRPKLSEEDTDKDAVKNMCQGEA
jgi:hypothetical protein